MRIVIAYDGSAQAGQVFDDLHRAGLPGQTEVLILTVAERRLGELAVDPATTSVLQTSSQAAAQIIANQPVQKLSAQFPSWRIHSEGASGSPVRRIVDRAREWNADLIVLGAIGHTALERILIGSVSYKVANEAHCSVRIARGRTPRRIGPIVIVLGYDDLPGARMAVRSVAGRSWPVGTRVILHTAVGFGASPVAELMLPEDRSRAQKMLEPATTILREAGLNVSTTVVEDDPKNSIVSAAERVAADCVFVGDNDDSALDRLFLGTVASAVVPRALCSVEIIR